MTFNFLAKGCAESVPNNFSEQQAAKNINWYHDFAGPIHKSAAVKSQDAVLTRTLATQRQSYCFI